MIIIAFCTRTSKVMPRIFCRHFRHCAPIVPNSGDATRSYMLYQFVRHGNIVKIPLNMRDIKLLRNAGWVFMWRDANVPTIIPNARTCVGLCCNMLGIKNRLILTPDDLYRALHRGIY